MAVVSTNLDYGCAYYKMIRSELDLGIGNSFLTGIFVDTRK